MPVASSSFTLPEGPELFRLIFEKVVLILGMEPKIHDVWTTRSRVMAHNNIAEIGHFSTRKYHRPPRQLFGRFSKNFWSLKLFDKNCYGTFWFMDFFLQKIESLEASKSNTQYLLSMFYSLYILPHNQSIFHVSLNVKSWVRTQSYLNWSRNRIVNNPSLVQESHQPGGSFTTSSVWVI